MNNHRLTLTLVLAFLVLFVTGFLSMRWKSVAQNTKLDDHDALVEALRHGGVREAARLKGHYVADFDPHWDLISLNLEQLTKNSALIVVGSVAEKLTAHPVGDAGHLIYTDYEVVVQEVIKGSGFNASTIVVSLPGGRIEFEDGTSAEIRTPKFEHVKPGTSYTFFLDEGSTGPNIYTLTGGPQGLVEFGGEKAKSHGRDTDPIAKEENNTDKEIFLNELRKNAKKWPNKGKCCG